MSEQRGFSVFKLLFKLCVMLVLLTLAYKTYPVVSEFNGLKSVIEETRNDHSLVGASSDVVLESLSKRAAAKHISYDEDLMIVDFDSDKRPMLAISYDKAIHLVGNISLEFHFETPDSALGADNPLGGAMASRNKMNESLKEQQQSLNGI